MLPLVRRRAKSALLKLPAEARDNTVEEKHLLIYEPSMPGEA
jgi:hypothetical protein